MDYLTRTQFIQDCFSQAGKPVAAPSVESILATTDDKALNRAMSEVSLVCAQKLWDLKAREFVENCAPSGLAPIPVSKTKTPLFPVSLEESEILPTDRKFLSRLERLPASSNSDSVNVQCPDFKTLAKLWLKRDANFTVVFYTQPYGSVTLSLDEARKAFRHNRIETEIADFCLAFYVRMVEATFISGLNTNQMSPWLLTTALRFNPLVISIIANVERKANPRWLSDKLVASTDKDDVLKLKRFYSAPLVLRGGDETLGRDRVGSGSFVLCSDNQKKRWMCGTISKAIPTYGKTLGRYDITVPLPTGKVKLDFDTACSMMAEQYPALSFFTIPYSASKEFQLFTPLVLLDSLDSAKTLRKDQNPNQTLGLLSFVLWQKPSLASVRKTLVGDSDYYLTFGRVSDWFSYQLTNTVPGGDRLAEWIDANCADDLMTICILLKDAESFFKTRSIAEIGAKKRDADKEVAKVAAEHKVTVDRRTRNSYGEDFVSGYEEEDPDEWSDAILDLLYGSDNED